jgi:hypothetical protein
MLNLHSLTPCSLLYSSRLLLGCFCRLLLSSLGIMLTYTYRCSIDTHHRKHMSCVRYPASILARWLDLKETRHVTSTHCCVTSPLTQRKHCSVLLAACCLAMDLHITKLLSGCLLKIYIAIYTSHVYQWVKVRLHAAEYFKTNLLYFNSLW